MNVTFFTIPTIESFVTDVTSTKKLFITVGKTFYFILEFAIHYVTAGNGSGKKPTIT